MNLDRLLLPLRQMVSIALSKHGRREVWRTPLYSNSVYLMANSAATAALGFIFWVVVARLYSAETVGLASALISSAALLVFVASLGLEIGLIRFLPGVGAGGSALINACFTLSGLIAMVVAAVFLAGVPLWSPALDFVRANPIFMAAFVAFVVAGVVLGLANGVFIALRRAQFTMIQGLILGLVKLALVVALASLFQVFGIFASWGLAVVTALGVSVLWFLPKLQPGYRPLPGLRRQVTNEMVHFSFANYLSNGLWSLPAWLLPLFVVNRLGGEANAYFYVAWAMAGLLFAIPSAISLSLFTEGSHQEAFLARDATRSLKLILVLLLPAIAVMSAAGDKLLLVFGSEYSAQGARLLWLLAPSAIPLSLNVVYLGIARVRKNLKDVIVVAAAIALGTLGLSYALTPHLGILAPGVGWLVSQTVIAVVVLPKVRSLLRAGVASETSVEGGK